jgi:hypothetical protein
MNMRDYIMAARELQAIVELIPDPYDLRNQKARIYLKKLKRGGLLR